MRIRLTGEFGTGDAELTGYLAACLAAVSTGPVELHISPDFTWARLDVAGEVRGRMIPLRLLWLTGGFLMTRPVRQLWLAKMGWSAKT